MRRLLGTDLSINEILRDIRLEEEELARQRRPKRSCAPSLKAAESAALPSASESTDTNDFIDAYVPFVQRKKKQTLNLTVIAGRSRNEVGKRTWRKSTAMLKKTRSC